MRTPYIAAALTALVLTMDAGAESHHRKTTISIQGRSFLINGQPTYAGRQFNGSKIEGLLMNSRMVQGIFDDLNPATRTRWNYPDGPWDPERNTREFIAAMPVWRAHGLLSFTINLQGGSPEGYSKSQPWHNSAFESDGRLRPDFMARLERILDKADELGMAPIVGCFYFGQDGRLKDEAAVVCAVDNAADWVLERGYRNVLIEVNNECNVRYDHAILRPDRVHELVERVKVRQHGGRRMLVSTSYGGGTVPRENVLRSADFLLLHGNGVREPDRIRKMVDDCRAMPAYRGQPILFNEDDHFDFEKPDNNMLAAISRYASWGYFDFRMKGESFDDGYQSVPVNWGISSARKRGFFDLLAKVTGSAASASPSDYDFAAMIQPVPATAKFSDPDYYIWCGTMVRGDDGKCHLFYSRWPRKLGHNAWVTHSEVAHAVGDEPLGPFTHKDVALPVRGKEFWDGLCTHNPTVLRFGKKFYIYYMGNTGDLAPTKGLNWVHRNNQRVGVAVADSPDGPWKRFDKPVIEPTPGFYDALCCANPTVTSRPGGGYLMVYKAVGDKGKPPFGGPVFHAVATSDSPTGPFKKHPNPIFVKEGVHFAAEDPFIWSDGRRYWAIVKDNAGHFTGAGKSTALWQSDDGFDWKLAKHPLVATTEIMWESGQKQKLNSLERPQLFFENGRPTVLMFASDTDSKREHSFNVRIPLKKP